jgi:hypothetical protein
MRLDFIETGCSGTENSGDIPHFSPPVCEHFSSDLPEFRDTQTLFPSFAEAVISGKASLSPENKAWAFYSSTTIDAGKPKRLVKKMQIFHFFSLNPVLEPPEEEEMDLPCVLGAFQESRFTHRRIKITNRVTLTSLPHLICITRTEGYTHLAPDANQAALAALNTINAPKPTATIETIETKAG